MIYLDNAATTFPKPEPVIRAVAEAMRKRGGNPGRGSHKLSTAASELVFDCRSAAADMFGANPENVVFTVNATHALNYAIKGLAEPGCHILIDNYAHNAAYRPVMALTNAGIAESDIYDASGEENEVLQNIESHLRPNTKIIIATHQSNICSRILPIEAIGKFCAEHHIHFIVDAAQSAGHLPIDVRRMNITSLCMPGHKGLFGPMGVGLLISGDDVRYHTIIEGGAGINSLDVAMPDELPERLEAGTIPLPAIAGLLAGINFVNRVGLEEIHVHECTLSAALIEMIGNSSGVTLYGDTNSSVIGFNLDGHSPAEAGEYLASHGICVRTGYHCAPLAHRTIGSFENGHIRAGFSYMNRMSDVNALARAILDFGKSEGNRT